MELPTLLDLTKKESEACYEKKYSENKCISSKKL